MSIFIFPSVKKLVIIVIFTLVHRKIYTVLVNAILKEIEINQKNLIIKTYLQFILVEVLHQLSKIDYSEKIIKKVKNQYNVFKNCEITIEVNPDDVNRKN